MTTDEVSAASYSVNGRLESAELCITSLHEAADAKAQILSSVVERLLSYEPVAEATVVKDDEMEKYLVSNRDVEGSAPADLDHRCRPRLDTWPRRRQHARET